jgi:DNA (cytosine-5)-methyltransferase 1
MGGRVMDGGNIALSDEDEIIVDCFAGGGGVSTGIEDALGISPHIAINHDAVAIAMHKANHPKTHHLNSNIFKVVPSEACEGRPIGMLWLSPDCKHFSRAKGAKPVEKRIRGLAWVALHWARLPAWQRPRIIFLENVPEFLTWGPLLANGRPDPDRKGEEFQKFIRALRRQGYDSIEYRIVVFCDYGDPTIRRRLQLIARCDGEPIVWPEPSHGNPKSEAVKSGKLPPWRTAADDVIDWTIPCPSIFLNKREVKRLWRLYRIRVQRPLRPKTMARIFKGLVRFVLECPDPFIIPVTHAGDLRSHSAREPVRTQTGAKRGEHALVVPYLAPRYQEKAGHSPRTRGVEQPMATMMPRGNESVLVTPFVTKFNRGATGHHAIEPLHTVTAHASETHGGGASPLGLVSATLVGCGGRAGQSPPRRVGAPIGTQTAKPDGCIVAAHLSRQFGKSVGSGCAEPVGAVTAGGAGKTALVAAFLAQHNYQEPGHDARKPASTVVSKVGPQAVVSAGLLNLKGSDRRGGPITAPTPAVTAQGGHLAEVRAFLIKFYKSGGQHQDARDPLHTLSAKARHGIVTVLGEDYQIVDIGMRMLTPRERFNAHSFPADYKIDILVPRTGKNGLTVMKPITAEEQGRMVGNSVPCRWVKAVVAANYRPRAGRKASHQSGEVFALEAAE